MASARWIGSSSDGDVVALDVVVSYQGFIGDNACTVPSVRPMPATAKLLRVTEEALQKGIAKRPARKTRR